MGCAYYELDGVFLFKKRKKQKSRINTKIKSDISEEGCVTVRRTSTTYCQQRQNAYSTWYSQAVSDPSTNQARPCLASEIGRDRAHSGWYGRRRRNLLFQASCADTAHCSEACCSHPHLHTSLQHLHTSLHQLPSLTNFLRIAKHNLVLHKPCT